MPVISNTSPLLNLAIVDHLFLLPQQFGQIYIPKVVIERLQQKANFRIAPTLLAQILQESGEL